MGSHSIVVEEGEGDIAVSLAGKAELPYEEAPHGASGAPFGSVVDFGERLVIVDLEEQVTELPGEVVRWRTFPQARTFRNQLHVIYEEHMTIFGLAWPKQYDTKA